MRKNQIEKERIKDVKIKKKHKVINNNKENMDSKCKN